MNDVYVSDSELPLRRRILAAFHDAARGSGSVISADTFQRILNDTFGLRFGDPVVDRIMVQCKINDEGNVDFSALQADVNHRDASAAYLTSLSTPPSPVRAGGPTAAAAGAYPHPPRAAAGDGATSLPPPTAGAAGAAPLSSLAGSSYEFRTALEATTGSTVPPTLPPELMALPQPERVRRMARELSALFTHYDTGRISLDTFRARMRDMGIVETPEVTRLLQQASLRFAALYKALQNDTSLEAPAAPPTSSVALYQPAAAGNVILPHHAHSSVYSTASSAVGGGGSRQPGAASRPGERGYTVASGGHLTHAPSTLVLEDGVLTTKAEAEAGHSTVMRNYNKISSDRSHQVRETGAGDIIFQRGGTAGTGVSPTGLSESRRHTPAYHAGAPLVQDSRVGAILFSGTADTPSADNRFETVTQASLRTGLFGKGDTEHRPATSAGYRTADHGLVREQIYGAVRQLDAGRMTGRAFRDRLTALGVPMPPGVERLVAVYENNGKADFGRFVRAFEEYFAASTHPVPAGAGGASRSGTSTPSGEVAGPTAGGSGAIPREALLVRDGGADWSAPVRPTGTYVASADAQRFTEGSTSGGAFYSPHINPAHRGHGDILGWSTPATAGEAEQQSKGKALPSRKLYDTYSPAMDLVSVEGRSRLALASMGWFGAASSEREAKDIASRRHMADARYKDSGPILAWPDASDGEAAAGGSAPADAGAVLASEFALFSGRGRAVVADNRVAAHDRAGPWSSPFATSYTEAAPTRGAGRG